MTANPTLTTPLDFERGDPPALAGMTAAGVERISAIFDAQIARRLHPGAQLVVLRHGRVAVDRAAGIADVKRRTPVGPETPFMTWSCTKAFTGMCVHRLVEDGRIAWDARGGGLLAGVRLPRQGDHHDPPHVPASGWHPLPWPLHPMAAVAGLGASHAQRGRADRRVSAGEQGRLSLGELRLHPGRGRAAGDGPAHRGVSAGDLLGAVGAASHLAGAAGRAARPAPRGSTAATRRSGSPCSHSTCRPSALR